MQQIPRQSIKQKNYNFADILGDINYIGDEKAPTFKKLVPRQFKSKANDDSVEEQ